MGRLSEIICKLGMRQAKAVKSSQAALRLSHTKTDFSGVAGREGMVSVVP